VTLALLGMLPDVIPERLVRTTAVHFQLGQCSVHFLQVVRCQNEFGGFDIFLKMLDLSVPGIGPVKGF